MPSRSGEREHLPFRTRVIAFPTDIGFDERTSTMSVSPDILCPKASREREKGLVGCGERGERERESKGINSSFDVRHAARSGTCVAMSESARVDFDF